MRLMYAFNVSVVSSSLLVSNPQIRAIENLIFLSVLLVYALSLQLSLEKVYFLIWLKPMSFTRK